MKKYFILLLVLSILTPSLSFAQETNILWGKKDSQVLQIETLLEKQYGSNIRGKLEKIEAILIKISEKKSPKILRLKTSLTQAKSNIIKENLESYVSYRYLKNSQEKKENFQASYESLRNIDPKADIHSSYLALLKKQIQEYGDLDEASLIFRSYIYLSFLIQEKKEQEVAFEEKQTMEWKESWQSLRDETSEKNAQKIAQTVVKILGINPYDSYELARMKQAIWSEKISPNSAYFIAYKYLRNELTSIGKTIRINSPISHLLQTKKLSCESNSATDLINHYRTLSGLSNITEEEFIEALPIREDAMVQVKIPWETSKFIWGNPNEYFVGFMDGKQRTNRSEFTGYGVHAGGIIWTINTFLKKQWLIAKKGIFSQQEILSSLHSWDPVMFWYLLPTGNKEDGTPRYATNPIEWETPEGLNIKGYIGEHVGVIVWADFDDSGNIEYIYFYQGRNESLEKVSFAEIEKTASLFNETISVHKSSTSRK